MVFLLYWVDIALESSVFRAFAPPRSVCSGLVLKQYICLMSAQPDYKSVALVFYYCVCILMDISVQIPHGCGVFDGSVIH